MNFYKILNKIPILLLVIFLGCSTKHVIVTGEPAQGPPVSGAKIQETVQPEVKPPEIGLPMVIKPPLIGYNRNIVGCMLPLSGLYADLGNKALDAILLSAGIFDQKNKTPWKVVVADSRGLPEGARAAIKYLANDQNVIAIVSVAGTIDAIEAAHEADKQKVPLILITAKEGVTSISEYVFQHFLTPTQQLKALVKYAIDDLNCAIFSILYPEDDYGEEMVKIFRAEAAGIGGKVEKAIPYSKKQTDFTEGINKLTGSIVNSPKKANADKDEPKTPIPINFEALFIPDSYLRVKMIASQLAFYDVKGFKLLGTSLWHSPDLLTKGAEYLDGAVFVDSFFTGSFYPETNDFVDIYYTTYSREPLNIEALAYDTSGIIFSILENKNVQTRQDFAAGLIQLENYRGATGSISFDSNRVAQKTAFILKVNNGKLEQVK